ncbi:MAG: WbqC family protein [Salinivirgaceae bacterium]|nr:WbqC family protein [Salinivirgaceae bacterium]
MNNYCLLPTSYWPNIQYFSKLMLFKFIVIEQFETYPKQSYRNRCELYGANSKQSIQIPVIKGSFSNILLKDIKISYETTWQNNHLKTIESAYRSSPFYEFYIDDIIPFYQKKYNYLLDYNLAILDICKEWLSIEKEISLTNDYNSFFNGSDYRNTIHPKANKQANDNQFKPIEYIQGFEQRHGFIPNLSILDLIFNAGPEARSIILKSLKNE